MPPRESTSGDKLSMNLWTVAQPPCLCLNIKEGNNTTCMVMAIWEKNKMGFWKHVESFLANSTLTPLGNKTWGLVCLC